MMSSNIKGYLNLIILFPPGLGGNHLRNIIMINSIFSDESLIKDIERYYDEVTTNYNFAHYRERSLHRDVVENYINSDNNLLCGHIAEYMWASDILENLPKKLFLTIDFEKIAKESAEFSRMLKSNPSIENSYFFQEQATIYNLSTVAKLTNSDEIDHYRIDSSLLFTRSIDGLLDFLSRELELTYTDEQIKIIKHIHKIWAERNLI